MSIYRQYARAGSPEAVERVMQHAGDLASRLQFPFTSRGEAALRDADASHDADRYERGLVAVNDAARAASSSSSTPPSEGGGYRSSVHGPERQIPVPDDIQAAIDRIAELARKRKRE